MLSRPRSQFFTIWTSLLAYNIHVFCETSSEHVTDICLTDRKCQSHTQRSFRKINAKQGTSDLSALLNSLFKSHHCIESYLKKSVEESEEISYTSFQSSKSLFGKIQICNLRNGVLLTFWLKLITASICIYEKYITTSRNNLHIATVFEELVSQNTDLQIRNSTLLLFGYRTEETVVTVLMLIISVQVYLSFVSFVSQSTANYSFPFVSSRKIQ